MLLHIQTHLAQSRGSSLATTHDEMLEMIAALLRVLRRPPLSPVTKATPRDNKEFSSGKSSGLFGWFLGGGSEEESDNDLESEAYEAPVNEVSLENPQYSWSTMGRC